MSQLNFNVTNDHGEDVPLLETDSNRVFTGFFESDARYILLIPPGVTGGATLYYDRAHGGKHLRVIVPPGDGQWEAGLPPCQPPEDPQIAMVYGDAAEPSVPPARPGRVSLVGKAFVDDAGPFYPLYSTMFFAVGAWSRGDMSRVKENLRFLAKYGYGPRLLAQVDWAGEEIDPFSSNYPLADVIDYTYDVCGQRSKLTLLGGGCRDVAGAATRVVEILRGREEKVFLLEAVNEDNASRDEAVQAARILRQTGIPTAVGWGDQGLDAVKLIGDDAGTNVDVLHIERTPPESRMARQCWDFHTFRRASDDGEGPGPASSGAQMNSPFWMATRRAGSMICGADSFCVHTGSGVFGRRYDSNYGPRYANLFDIPGFVEMLQATKNAETPMFLGMANWATTNTKNPVTIASGKVDKLYGCQSGDNFAEICLGSEGPIAFRSEKPADWKVFNPATGLEVNPGDANIEAYVIIGKMR